MTFDELQELETYEPWSVLAVDCLLYHDSLSAVVLPMVVAAETLDAVKGTVDIVFAARRAGYPGS